MVCFTPVLSRKFFLLLLPCALVSIGLFLKETQRSSTMRKMKESRPAKENGHMLTDSRNSGPNITEVDGEINIVFMVDEKMLHGVPTVINSVWRNTKRAIRIFIFVTKGNQSHPSQYLSCYLGNLTKKRIHVKVIDPSRYIHRKLYAHMNRHAKRRRTSTESVYMRFYLYKLLPEAIHRVIYLDADLVVLADIGKLWDLCAHHRGILSGVYRDHIHTTIASGSGQGASTPATWALYRHGLRMNTTFRAINNGMIVMNLPRLRAKEELLLKRLYSWAVGDTRYRWFSFDIQQLMAYTFYGELAGVPEIWNVRAVWKYEKPAIIHFSGKEKPWLDQDSRHKEVWQRYKVQPCSGHGECVTGLHGDVPVDVQYNTSSCNCAPKYTGHVCGKELSQNNSQRN